MDFAPNTRAHSIAAKIGAFAVTLFLFGVVLAAGGCTLATGVNSEPHDLPTTIDVSPDGKHLVFTGNGRGDADIFTLDLASGKVEQLTDTDTQEMQPKYSPDGQSIVFSRAKPGYRPDVVSGNYLFERFIYVMDLGTKKVTQITDDPAHYDYSPAFSSDGRFVVFDGVTLPDNNDNLFGSDIYCTELATNKTTRLTNEGFDSVLDPVFSHDDTAILFTAHQNEKEKEKDAEGSYLVSLAFQGSAPVPFTSAQVVTPKGANYYSGRPMEDGGMVLISDPRRKWVWRLTIRDADDTFTYLDDSINGLSSPTYDQGNQRIFYLEGMNNLYCYDLKTNTKKKIANGSLFRDPLTSELDQLP